MLFLLYGQCLQSSWGEGWQLALGLCDVARLAVLVGLTVPLQGLVSLWFARARSKITRMFGKPASLPGADPTKGHLYVCKTAPSSEERSSRVLVPHKKCAHESVPVCTRTYPVNRRWNW